jgi:sulfur carrier protein ThiS
MQVTIKLFGTLRMKVADYDHLSGIVLDMPDRTTPADLLETLGVPMSDVGIISCNSKVLKPDMPLVDGTTINYFSLIGGG